MNLHAATGTSQASLMGALTSPVANHLVASPPFMNLISRILSPATPQGNPLVLPQEDASGLNPATIALMRSLSGSQVSVSRVTRNPPAPRSANPAPIAATAIVSAPTVETPSSEIKTTTDSAPSLGATTPAIQGNEVAPPESLAGMPSEAGVAFTAVLTPATEASAANVVTTPEPAASQGGETSSPQGDSQPTLAQSTVIATDTKTKLTAPKVSGETSTGVVPDHSSAATSLTEPVQPTAAIESTEAAAAATPSPSQSVAEALRTSESNLAMPAQRRTGVAQEITIRIEQPAGSPVYLRVVERSRKLHVDVRTADATMQTSLRADLGALTSSLHRAGYRAKTFTPSASLGRTVSSSHVSIQ